METFNNVLEVVNSVIWHKYALFVVLGVGVIFTIWSAFSQYRVLTHGVQVIRGKYDDPNDPGAINHFQALSAALSATIGLGNIGGVAVAVALGGPGAVLWMWLIGIVGMALKTTGCVLSMLYRNTDDPDNPHGGPMWVASRGLADMGFGPAGKMLGGIFCITLLISAITGGNMFQAWNVGIVTENATGGSVPSVVTGIVLAVIVGMVIVGGIKRIGAVAGKLVPIMCIVYFLSAVFVIALRITDVPAAFAEIFTSAFSQQKAQGAFIGGTVGYAFLWGMKRALFSSEAGQGSAPIAHAAAKTNEPVREALVAGLGPFIDTIVVCTLTALVIILSGAWNRPAEAQFAALPVFAQVEADPIPGEAAASDVSGMDEIFTWTLGTTPLPPRTAEAKKIAGGDWSGTEQLYAIVRCAEINPNTGTHLFKIEGDARQTENGHVVDWAAIDSEATPVLLDGGIFNEYPGAALTTYAFDTVKPGLGTWLVLLASWLFAISTMISWSYYGEQGMVFLLGERSVLPYKLIYCLFIIVATLGFIKRDSELDALTALGTGVMLWANIPIMIIFGRIAMTSYHKYIARLKAGEFHPHD